MQHPSLKLISGRAAIVFRVVHHTDRLLRPVIAVSAVLLP